MSVLLAAYLSTLLRILPLVVCGLVGFIWGKRDIAYPTAFVSTLVTYVAIPLLVFHTLMTTPLEAQALMVVLGASTAALLVAAPIVAVVLRVFGLPVGALVQTAWIPNAGNLGLPMATLVFGAEGLTVAIAFFAVSSFLSFTLGLRWLTGSAGKASRQPVIWATLLAVLAPLDWPICPRMDVGQCPVAWQSGGASDVADIGSRLVSIAPLGFKGGFFGCCCPIRERRCGGGWFIDGAGLGPRHRRTHCLANGDALRGKQLSVCPATRYPRRCVSRRGLAFHASVHSVRAAPAVVLRCDVLKRRCYNLFVNGADLADLLAGASQIPLKRSE